MSVETTPPKVSSTPTTILLPSLVSQTSATLLRLFVKSCPDSQSHKRSCLMTMVVISENGILGHLFIPPIYASAIFLFFFDLTVDCQVRLTCCSLFSMPALIWGRVKVGGNITCSLMHRLNIIWTRSTISPGGRLLQATLSSAHLDL